MQEPIKAMIDAQNVALDAMGRALKAQQDLLKTLLTLLISTGTIDKSALVKLLKK